jgi:hypothetical protein
MPPQNVDINAIRQALLARSNVPSMGQGQTTPMLSQVGQPTGPTPTGGQPTLNRTPATVPTPGTPQPQFSSPFAGPGAGAANQATFDDETRRMSKGLIAKLLQVL